ncbi:coiled-coil domain-containing protein [Arthrobacter sp. A5]|uniref:coiled-coil domain-containing protein n=1 Tax=Arthrobacter sp. A5 TaxID=576926 RepID=UPI003DAA0EF8
MDTFGTRFKVLGTAAVLACTLVLPAALAGPVSADDSAPPSGFPSWQDVQTAKQDEASKSAEVGRINSLLDGLQTEADQLGNAAVEAGGHFAVAKSDLDSASAKVDLLAAQAQKADALVAQYKKEAGALVAQSYKSGGSSIGLFASLDALGSKDGLQRLDVLGIVTDRATTMYNKSTAAQGTAKALADQEQVARAERARLAGDAEQKLNAAVGAQTAVETQVARQKQQSGVLVAQLASLKDSTVATEDQYRQGQTALAAYAAAQEAKRLAAVEQAAAQQAAQQAGANSGAAVSAAAPAVPAPVSTDYGSGYIPVSVLLPNIPGNGVNDPAGAQAYASSRLGAYGWGQDQLTCLVQLWIRESSWQTNATNRSSGAYGIAQALLPSKYAESGSDWLTNYRTQINWGLGYIRDRYGSPCGAWAHEVAQNWY